jgi:hypothetical protein
MRKNLADIITEIGNAKATGILTLSLSNDSSLFKIFFRNGYVYHITHSTCKDKQCLVKMADHTFLLGQFMPGAQVDMQNESVISNEELIDLVRKANKTVEWGGGPGGSGKAAGDSGISSTVVDAGAMARMNEELLNVVGPVAVMVLANAYSTCGLKQGQPLMKNEFQRLIKAIGEQLPGEQRNEFLNKFT